MALQVAHDRYRPGAVADKFTAANQRTTLFCQIETAEGVENADAMAAIDGVDCLWVGHFDLSVSLGIPGEFDHQDFKRRDRRTIAAARKKHKKALGPARADCRAGHRRLQAGLRFHLLFRRCLGAAQRARRRRSTKLRAGVQGRSEARRWPTSSASRCPAISRRRTARRPIRISTWRRCSNAPGVEMAFLESAQPDPRRAARGFRRADPARPPLRARERAEERAARRRGALRRRLRHRRRRRPAPRPASRSSSRPTACAGRSRSRSSR